MKIKTKRGIRLPTGLIAKIVPHSYPLAEFEKKNFLKVNFWINLLRNAEGYKHHFLTEIFGSGALSIFPQKSLIYGVIFEVPKYSILKGFLSLFRGAVHFVRTL